LRTRSMREEGQEISTLKKVNPFNKIDMRQFANILHERAASLIHFV
jgi:mannosyl-3-phosphoglycerate synthase